MKRLGKISFIGLVVSNAAIALALTVILYTWAPWFAGAGFFEFIVLFLVVAAGMSLITVLSLSFAAASDDDSQWALEGGYDAAINIRDKALNTHTIVSVTSPDGEIKEVNENFIKTFGYSEKEIVGETMALLYVEDSVSTPFEDVRSVVSKGMSWKGHQELKAKNGRVISVETTIIPRFDLFGKHTDSISIRTDMTTARAKAASEGRNAVIENLPDGVIVYDPDSFEIIYVNKFGRSRLGWSADMIPGRTMFDTFSNFDEDLFRRYLDPLLKGEKKQVTIQVRHDDGPVEVLTHFDTGPHGKPSLISVVRDITERVEAEQLKLGSVSMVSHELRTPLTSIKGALRLLESGTLGELPANAHRMISVAHRNSDRLLTIVNDILSLEKMNSGDMDFTWQTVDLQELLVEAAEAHAGYADEANVRFVVKPVDTPTIVSGDPDRLMQVLANLMSNAAKFSPADAEVQLYVQDGGEAWRVCIEDFGPGIPPDAHKTLFDSFFQVKDDAKFSRPGTGLGLTICKRIVEMHGGTIAFDTEIGRGTIFYFDLTKQQNQAKESTNAA